MSVATVAASERAALCDLMVEVGPHAPTLDEGWEVIDLAAHLVAREHDVWATPGVVWGGPFGWAMDKAMVRRRRHGLDRLVEIIRRGPPRLWRLAPPGAHLYEYFIHHEDVRRANGRQPRTDRQLDEALARLLRASASTAFRRLPTSLDLVWNGGVLARHGPEPRAVLDGAPGELLLYLSGRKKDARVELTGNPVAAERIATADLRI